MLLFVHIVKVFSFIYFVSCICFVAHYSEHVVSALICVSFVSLYFQGRLFHPRADPFHTSYQTSQWIPRVMASSVVGTRPNFSTQSLSMNEPVVSVDWLHANLREPNLKVPAISFL